MSNLEIFEKRINGKLPVLVDFYNKGVASCRTMQTILKIVTYRLEGKVLILSVDLDIQVNQDILHHYLPQVTPTFILFQEGKIRWKASGLFTSRQLVAIIEQVIQSSAVLETN